MRIALDLDGVLVEWDHAFAALLSTITGRTPSRGPDWPSVWEWPKADGYTADEIRRAWRFVDENPEWWFYLPPTRDGAANAFRIAQLSDQEEVLIITNRRKALNPSMAWVLREIGVAIPVIPIVGPKGPLFDLLKIDIAVDDKPENLLSSHTVDRLILIDTTTNRTANDPRLERSSLEALLDELVPREDHSRVVLEPLV